MKTGIKTPSPSQTNYPADMKKPAYPSGSKFPAPPTIDFHTSKVPNVGNTTPKPPMEAELPVGGQMDSATVDKHQRGVEMDTHRGQSQPETAPTLSPRGDYVQSDLTQGKVMEKNDPTHDGKSFKNRSWEDGNFDNRRLFY